MRLSTLLLPTLTTAFVLKNNIRLPQNNNILTIYDNDNSLKNNPHYFHNNKRGDQKINDSDTEEMKNSTISTTKKIEILPSPSPSPLPLPSPSPVDKEEREILCPLDTIIIEKTSDLHVFDHCNTITNDLVFTNEFMDSVIDLRNLEIIGGNLIIEDISNLIKLRAMNLQTIEGDFIMTSLTSLIILETPRLSFTNSINWRILPILNQVDISPNIFVKENLIISDTSISNLEGFNSVKELETFNINNNRFLETIKANLKNVKKQFSIHANSKDLQIELPFLTQVENMTIRDTQSIWLPNLQSVKTNLEFIENNCMEIDLSTLEKIGGTLGIIDNPFLSKLNFQNVTDIQGGLMIDNNNRLEKLDTFTSLKTIGGAIHFDGNFKDTDFPKLKLVKGSAYIKTSSDELDCNKWIRPLNGRSIIRGGKIKCTSAKKQNSISVDEDGKILDMVEKEVDNDKTDIKTITNMGNALVQDDFNIFNKLIISLLVVNIVFFFQ